MKSSNPYKQYRDFNQVIQDTVAPLPTVPETTPAGVEEIDTNDKVTSADNNKSDDGPDTTINASDDTSDSSSITKQEKEEVVSANNFLLENFI